MDFLHYLLMLLSAPIFILKIKDGEVHRVKGNLKNRIVSGFSDLVRSDNIKKGYIYGVRKKKQVGLKFSPSFPKQYFQQFRNFWYASKY